MDRWEYIKIDLNSVPRRMSETDVLNDAGALGWELVLVSPTNVALLKRVLARPHATATKKTKKDESEMQAAR